MSSSRQGYQFANPPQTASRPCPADRSESAVSDDSFRIGGLPGTSSAEPDRKASGTVPDRNRRSIRINAPAALRPAPEPPDDSRRRHKRDVAVKLGIVFGVLAVLAGICLTWDTYELLLMEMRSRLATRVLLLAGAALLAINVSALIWRISLVSRYRPAPCGDDDHLPEITVVVPAYNEGRQVYRTLHSLVRSDFPSAKMHIIAVDDGSQDNTWYWIQRAALSFPGRILTIRCSRNRGKRRALYEGFRKSKGQVLVTVDSDSEVESGTLRRLVSPFITDGRVGAVAGNVRVLNRSRGLIPRMLDVSFTYSFDFIRAGQSRINTVMCTPGALSAYRRDLVMRVLAEWLGQTFCGRPANIGEDRAMTNLILRSGAHVHYQRDAAVYTNVPLHYGGLCRMFLRWARSNIRETIVMSRFAFRRFRDTPASGARINLLLHWISLTVPQVLRTATILFLLRSPLVFGLHLLLGTILVAGVPAAVYFLRHRSTEGLWALPYGLFWLAGLSWITPFALLTPHRTGWLTRKLRGRPARKAAALKPIRAAFSPRG